jgi:hypothetical protein
MFLRELLRTCLAYLAVAVVFGLWGTPYAIAEVYGWTSWPLFAVALTGGFVSSLFIWRRIGPRDFSPPIHSAPSTTSPSAGRLRQHR